MSEVESIGDIVQRVMKRSAAKWARKNSSEQSIQRIDELSNLLAPGFVCRMNVGKKHYPAGVPPHPDQAAHDTIQDAIAKGVAADLSDLAIAASVARNLVAHWKGMIEQEESEKRKPRSKLTDAWPTGGGR